MAEDEDAGAVSDSAPLPPAGEPIHLPDPSYLPVLVALGVTIALVGVVVNSIICGLGVAVAVVSIVRWMSQTRTEMAELPLEL